MQSIDSTDPAEMFMKAALRIGDEILANVRAQDPEFAAKIALVIEQGERLRISLTLDAAPLIELATVDDYGTAKRIGFIRMKPRTAN